MNRFDHFSTTSLGQKLAAVIDAPDRYTEMAAFTREGFPAITAMVSLLRDLLEPLRAADRKLFDEAKQFCGYRVGEIMRELVCSRFDWIEGELAQRSYLAGPRFTVADITALCAIDFGKISNLRIKAETHPNLAAWYARVSGRPSAKA